MNNILTVISGAKSIGISGHIRPDGDCTGSCLALFNYLTLNCPGVLVDIYLEYVPDKFAFLKNSCKVNTEYDREISYDVFISLDAGSLDRLGSAEKYFVSAKKTVNIDHHISNTKFAMQNHVVPEASSTCEVLYDLLQEDKITKDIAEALYLGIIHDTGVFKHSNTTRKTLEIAGKLIQHGFDFSSIIDESFYQKTFQQNQLLGRCLLDSFLVLDKRCIITVATKEIMNYYHADAKDLDGIIDQLRITEGTEAAVLLHETGDMEYKVSMRACGSINVSEIATYFGGGGHVKAAGCAIKGDLQEVIHMLTTQMSHQMTIRKDTNK